MECGEPSHIAVIQDDEKQPEEQEKKPVELRISVFFDGTGNNRGNIVARRGGEYHDIYQKIKSQNPGKSGESKYSSFSAGFSNIALLEENFKSTTECKIFKAFYIEGVATRDLKTVAEDFENKARARAETLSKASGQMKRSNPVNVATDSDLWGNGMATGSTGLYAKVDRAMNLISSWLAEEVFKYDHGNGEIEQSTHEFTKIVVDVFGFSRGAATARHFVHHITTGIRTLVRPIPLRVINPFLPNKLLTENVVVPTLKRTIEMTGYSVKKDAVKIGFVGLFDTVSSYVIALTTDVKILHLDAIKQARKVYHLAAAEEHRACFSLTNIESAKKAGKGEEYFLPGVHSDIGGGYRDLEDGGGEKENYELMNDDVTSIAIYQSMRIGGLFLDYQAFMREIAEEGWYQPCALDKWFPPSDKPPGPGEMWLEEDGVIFRDVALKVQRNGIAHSYRCIPLQLMAEVMEKNDFVLDPNVKKEHKVPSGLNEIEQMIRSYIGSVGGDSKAEHWFRKKDKTLETFRNKHLHYSARIETGHWPRFKDQIRYRQTYDG